MKTELCEHSVKVHYTKMVGSMLPVPYASHIFDVKSHGNCTDFVEIRPNYIINCVLSISTKSALALRGRLQSTPSRFESIVRSRVCAQKM